MYSIFDFISNYIIMENDKVENFDQRKDGYLNKLGELLANFPEFKFILDGKSPEEKRKLVADLANE
jgi:hypothetical protein